MEAQKQQKKRKWGEKNICRKKYWLNVMKDIKLKIKEIQIQCTPHMIKTNK